MMTMAARESRRRKRPRRIYSSPAVLLAVAVMTMPVTAEEPPPGFFPQAVLPPRRVPVAYHPEELPLQQQLQQQLHYDTENRNELFFHQVSTRWDNDEEDKNDHDSDSVPLRTSRTSSPFARVQHWWRRQGENRGRRTTSSSNTNPATGTNESSSSTSPPYQVVNQPDGTNITDPDDAPHYYPYTNYSSSSTANNASNATTTEDLYQPPSYPDNDQMGTTAPGLDSSDEYNNSNSTGTNNTTPQHFARMRIRALLLPQPQAWMEKDDDTAALILTDDQRHALLHDMVQPALDVWGQALRVRPVVGPLVLEANQLRDGQWCGPGPAVAVPSSHMTVGLNETDFVLYLHVGRRFTASSANAYPAGNVTEDGYYDEDLLEDDGGNPDAHNETNMAKILHMDDTSWQRNQTDGWWNETEPWENVTLPSENYLCHGDYIAASAFCNTDQWDRPVAAILHLCIDEEFFAPHRLHRNIRTILHEMGHALGMNAVSLAHFRRWDDLSPLTPRDTTGAVPLQRVACTGPQSGQATTEESSTTSSSSSTGSPPPERWLQSDGTTLATSPLPPTTPNDDALSGYTDVIPLPSPDILQFRTVRGGVRVAQIVTPSVLQVVRNHFDCQTLEGAELESGEHICLGDHWERRLFKTDLMNPIIDTDADFVPRISTVTLAYFADSGWYQVDLSQASFASSWGRGAGCAFVEEPCVGADGQVPPGLDSVFCSSRTEGYHSLDGCTHDLLKKASCLIDQYSEQLPEAYQYFNLTYGSNVGGPDPFVDYCPYYAGFNNGLCSDESNEAYIKVSPMERVGSRNSRCLAGRTPFGKTALCLRIACVVEDKTLRVQVDKSWFTCTYEGQVIQTRLGFQVTCPDPIRTCPTFYCPRDCLGSPDLICDYAQGECVCPDEDRSLPLADGSCPSTLELGDVSDTEGSPSGPGNTGGSSNGNPFYKPPTDDGDVLPQDNHLQDIYFPSERALIEQVSSEEPGRDPFAWHWPVIGAAGFLFITLSMAVWMRRHKQQFRLPLTSLDFPGHDDNDDQGGDGLPPPTSGSGGSCWRPGDKRKMMATVVVDLRLQDQLSDIWVQEQQQQHADAQTDVASLTDTEGDLSFVGSSTPNRTRRPPPMAEEYLRPTIVEIPAPTPLEMGCPPPVARSTIRRRLRRRRMMDRQRR